MEVRMPTHVDENPNTFAIFGEAQTLHLDVEGDAVAGWCLGEDEVLLQVVIEAGPADVEIADLRGRLVAERNSLLRGAWQFEPNAGFAAGVLDLHAGRRRGLVEDVQCLAGWLGVEQRLAIGSRCGVLQRLRLVGLRATCGRHRHARPWTRGLRGRLRCVGRRRYKLIDI